MHKSWKNYRISKMNKRNKKSHSINGDKKD